MIKSLTLFPKSMDSEKIEDITSRLIPNMKSANGLQSLTASDGHLMSPGGPPAYSKVIESTWDSLENFMAWAQSPNPENHADKDFMLENGAALLFYEVKDL